MVSLRSEKVLIPAAVLFLAGAGAIGWTFLRPVPAPPQQTLEIPGQRTSSTPTPTTSSAPNTNSEAAKAATVRFVLAVANPSKLEVDTPTAVALLNETLKAQAGSDPAKLFGIATPASFTVSDPNVRRDVAATTVTFKFNGGADIKFDVTLKQENNQWLITGIERINVRGT